MSGLEDLTPEQRSQLNLAQLLLSDPDTSKQARRLAQKLKPELKFSDIELEDQIAASNKSAAKRVEGLEQQLAREKFERERAAMHAKLRERNLDPAAVEKVMTENGIANYELAAEVLEARSLAAAPTPDDVTPLTMPTGTQGAKDLWKDPRGYAQAVAYDVLNGFKRNRMRA